MADKYDLPSESDESDDDYVPEGAEEVLSEENSNGESENDIEDNGESQSGNSKKRRKRKPDKSSKRKKKTVNKEESDSDDNKTVEKKKLSEKEEKERADMLWADFMKDTDTPSKSKLTETNAIETTTTTMTNVTSTAANEKPKEDTVKIKEVFEFAGEEVTVEKEVPITTLTKVESAKRSPLMSENVGSAHGGRAPIRRGGGMSSVLGQLGKRAKISTLEKSKLDWENFKKQENLEEEINTHNKGKDGYLEKQDFLQRTDLRQFEIEKQMRSNNRRSAR